MKLIEGPLAAALLVLLMLTAASHILALHDRNTRRDTLAVIARELPVGASLADAQAFMERHTERFARDDEFPQVYGGFLPQSSLDRDLFDRQVQINLYFDAGHRFKSAEVNVYYTFL